MQLPVPGGGVGSDGHLATSPQSGEDGALGGNCRVRRGIIETSADRERGAIGARLDGEVALHERPRPA